MRTNPLSLWSIALFSFIAPLVGCSNPPPVVEQPDHLYWCNAPTDGVMLCNGWLSDHHRFTCQSDQLSATVFCQNECAKAAQENGQLVDCSTAIAEEYLVSGEQQHRHNEKADVNKELTYAPDKVCEGGTGVIPTDDPDLNTIWCHGTAEPTNPAGVADVDFDDRALSYWNETWESGSWHYTPSYIPFNGGCGYKIISIEEPDADEACRTWCNSMVDWYDGASTDNEGYEDDVRILHHNCDSFVSGSLCTSGAPDGVPVAPPLVGPVSTSLSLTATVVTGSGQTTSTLAGGLAYSTYACPPTAASCPIKIHSLSFSASQAIQGSLPSAAGPTPFTVSNFGISMVRPVAGAVDSTTGAFTLEPNAVRARLTGRFKRGTTSPVSFDYVAENSTAITGSLAPDGSILLSGSMNIGQGVTVSF